MADSQQWRRVQLEGLAATILVVTSVFSALSLLVVSLRVYARYTIHSFGVEDSLMCAGTVINMVHNGIVIWGTFTGIGTHDSKLNAAQQMQGGMAVVLWQLFYVSGSAFIKSSICATLIRIAVQQRYIYILRGLIATTVLSTIVAMLAVLIRCKPVAASWNPSLGTCIDQKIIIILTYIVSGVNILTDLAVGVLPVFILWDVQMPKKLKAMTALVLGIGLLASVATIIRLPYSSAYNSSTNLLYNLGHIILWTVVECDLGIIAGSLPMLRKLIKSLAKDKSSAKEETAGNNNIDLVTIGQVKCRHNLIYENNTFMSITGREDNESDGQDDESTRRIIRVTRVVEQTSAEA